MPEDKCRSIPTRYSEQTHVIILVKRSQLWSSVRCRKTNADPSQQDTASRRMLSFLSPEIWMQVTLPL